MSDDAPRDDPGPEARPGLLARTQRLRLVVLLVLLAGAIAAFLAARSGHLAYVHRPPFGGKLALAHGVEVEQVDVLLPAARLVVARIPRGKGLGLRALLLSPERQDLLRLGQVVDDLDALVAINGDYHRLDGFCFATTFSTLVDDGRVRVLGSPFGYAAQLWVDTDGVPHVGKLDLRGEARFPDGATLPFHLNLQQGDLVLVDRPPGGKWSAEGYLGLQVTGSLADGKLRAKLALGRAWRGQALLARVGSPAEAALRKLLPSHEVALKLVGADAGRVALALGTGPRLLENGEVHADAKLGHGGWVNRLGRTAVGFNAETLFLVTTLQAPHSGLSMAGLAEVMRDLGCTEALNLDGGPSSTLWADGRVLNVLGPEGDAAVASALVVLPPGQGTALR